MTLTVLVGKTILVEMCVGISSTVSKETDFKTVHAKVKSDPRWKTCWLCA